MRVHRYKKSITIKKTVIIVFVIAMLISIAGIGYIVFGNWFSSAELTTENIVSSLNENINEQISSLMYMPQHINEINHTIIENGILDLYDDENTDKFFGGALAHNEDIYSFSYGTANGEYYGARRNKLGGIEIIKSNAYTGGYLWYYSFSEDMTDGELVAQTGMYDPRISEWYMAAKKAGEPVLSPVYKHFIMDDLAITAAWPIYDDHGNLHGVLGTHILLSGIGDYLEDAVSDYSGYAIIAEKNTGYLIGNSMGIDSFAVLKDGTVKRYDIHELNTDLADAFEYYNIYQASKYEIKGQNEKLYINTDEIKMAGFDWIVITAVPESLLMSNVTESIYLTVLFVAVTLVLSLIIYDIITEKLLSPINNLLDVSESLSSGDLSRRVEVVRNDEIGSISKSLNKVADKMQYLINNLEANVRERTDELNKANSKLEENKNKLQLILDSTAEAIYGIDLNGYCTFCNISCLKILGYRSQEELLGKDMHLKIHHSHRDGTPALPEDCRIFQSIRQAKGFDSEDEVFWRADGTPIDVECHSYPQFKNRKVIGGVITFMDITERKQREREIQYLNCHDSLTGLYNRRCFEDKLGKTDVYENLPLSVIFADINGLKMTNDIFGHAAGDELIKKSAEILTHSCRDEDMIARIGGDEFIVLLPKTNESNARKILTRIRSGFSNARISAIKCSISLGLDTKYNEYQSIEVVMANAENAMYKDKTINRKSVNKEIIDTIVETLHSKSSRESEHSAAVSELCEKVGKALHLPEPEISKLKRAGYLHDIGKIILDEKMLSKEALTEEEHEEMQQHSVVGYRILNLFDETLDLAEYIYSHHERWDGAGYPRGLKGEQIPLISRIVSIAETYERVLFSGDLPLPERRRNAIEVIRQGSGKQFDPEIVNTFVTMMDEENI